MKLLTLQIFSIVCTGCLTLYEGEKCVTESTGENELCISVFECESAKRMLKANQKPQVCGFNRQTILVCCTERILKEYRLYETKSHEMCAKYYRDPIVAVAHGEKAELGEFPHMAAIGFSKRRKIFWLCGGSLISEKFILTAAHCTHSQEFGPPTIIRLGDLDLNNKTDGASPENIKISQIYTHPNYTSRSVYNDIALIKLQKRIYFGLDIKPACLHFKKDTPRNLQATGWGKTDFLGESSSHLMKVNLNVMNHELCARKYPKERRLNRGIVNDLQICAGNSRGGDTCPGDSGGPLHFWESEKFLVSHFVLVGVTSSGKACGFENSAGIYTRVSHYVPWIEKIVWP